MRIGFVGAGAIAARHLNAIATLDEDVEVVAHMSRDIGRAKSAAGQFGGAAFDSLETFVSQSGVDAVFVTVPPHQHGAIEHSLIAAGIPFLVEKPIGLDRAVPAGIAEGIAAAKLVVGVGYNWRSLDTLARVRLQLERTPARMVIGRFHVGTPAAAWWRVDASSGGQMMEQACHLIDLARHLIGEGHLLAASAHHAPPEGYAGADIASASAAMFSLQGVPTVVTATCVLPGGPGAELRIICDGCEMVLTLAGLDIIAGGQIERLGPSGSSYAAQNKRFFAAVRSGDPSAVSCSYVDAQITHELCLAVRASIVSAE